MAALRRALLRHSVWFSKGIGKIGDPFVERQCNWVDVAGCRKFVWPGVVLVTRKRLEMTNLFIPGRYTHAAIVGPDPSIIVEAVGLGVIRSTVESFVLTHDEVVALAPTYVNRNEQLLAAQWAHDQVGKGYDYLFDDAEGQAGDEAFFCAELVYKAYKQVEGCEPTMKRMKTLGVSTVTPNDFVQAHNKWWVVWTSAAVKAKDVGL